ncbi:MAG: glycosyltransferase family 2 protein [Bacteroidales bacterium]|nr:glycosyltransferase family 2 protein [Bacteroidales bacterium]
MKTAIVILNWNTKGFLEQFLPGVLSSAGCAEDGTPGGDYTVVVADNGSTDGSAEFMKERFPGASLITLDKNYGFTGGYNRALAQLSGFDCFLLLNSDIEVPKGWLEPLTEFMEKNPDCGICAPVLHAWQDKDRFEYAGAAGGFIDRYGFPFCRGRVLKWTEKDEGQYGHSPADVFWATGASLMVRCSLWQALGGLDDRFFAHMEEIDFCWRAHLEGWRACVVPVSTIYHLGGGTLPAESPGKLKLNYRNNLLMLHNNLAKTLAVKYLREGLSASKASTKARCRAGRRIFTRMVLDGISAAIFLLTGRTSSFKAVTSAHKEYKKLRGKAASAKELEAFLSTHGNACISGIYNHCLPISALVFGKKSFGKLQRGIK